MRERATNASVRFFHVRLIPDLNVACFVLLSSLLLCSRTVLFFSSEFINDKYFCHRTSSILKQKNS